MEKDFSDLIDIKQVVRMVNITPAGIYGRIKSGTFPNGLKIGSARLWPLEEVEEWLKSKDLARA